MIPAQLLTATLFLSAAMAVAQGQIPNSPDAKQTAKPPAGQNASTDHEQSSLANDPRFLRDLLTHSRTFTLDGQLTSDTVCYKIRSYVVARDSKHSDSVHPVGYSTCQPASRYRLRTTQADSLSR